MKKDILKRLSAVALAAVVAVSLVPVIGQIDVKAATQTISNPRVESFINADGKADLKSTWDCIYFGNYPQNDNTGETAEPIKWRVLSVEGNDAFILSDQNLDCQRYHSKATSVTWETCALREWLNNDFYNAAFSESDQNAVLTTSVSNGTGTENTLDKVYLLSVEEAANPNYGFPSDYSVNSMTRQASNTGYAIEKAKLIRNGVYTGNVWWHLRSMGNSSSNAAFVDQNGGINTNGTNVYYYTAGVSVRPVLHIDLSIAEWTYAGTICSDGTSSGDTTDYFELEEDNNHFHHRTAEFYNMSFVFASDNDQARKVRGLGYDVVADDGQAQMAAVLSNFARGGSKYCWMPSKNALGQNYEGGYAKVTDPQGYTYYTKYKDKLYSDCGDANQKTLSKEMNSKWGGSCFGMAYSMILSSESRLNNVFGSSTYYNLGKPKSNDTLKDVINYYQLLQFRDDLKYDYITYKNNSKTKDSANRDLSGFLTQLVYQATLSQDNHKPFLLTYSYNGGGHALIVCGYNYDQSKSEHVIKIYDCNHVSDYLDFRVSDDFSSFEFTDGNGEVLQEEYLEMNFFSVATLDTYSTIASSSPVLKSSAKASSDIENVKSDLDNTATLTISAFAKCKVTNAAGDTLIYDGNDYSGTMEVYDDKFAGDNDPRIEYTVDASESFTITDIEEGVDFTAIAVIDGDYFRTDTTDADLVFLSNEGIAVDGGDYEYDITHGKEGSGAVSVGVSGKGHGQITTDFTNEFSVNLENASEYVTVTKYSEDGSQNELIPDNVNKVTVNILNDELQIKKNIVTKDINDYTVQVTDQPFTGNAVASKVSIGDGYKTLTEGTDFTVSYGNNTNVGTATATIVGKGNYTGTMKKSFRIQFKDVLSNHQFYDPIYWAVDNTVTTGWSDGTFRPWNTCNRAAVVTFLWRMAGKPEPSKLATFKDMPANTAANQDFRKAISWAVEQGITTGWSDNTFRPWQTCNRAAIMTFIWRYADKPAATQPSSFNDKTGTADFDAAIAWASEKGISTGYDDGTFGPWRDCNRASVAAFLYRYDSYK